MKRNFMKDLAVTAVAASAVLAWSGAWAQEHATRAEAEAMVKKGVAYIKANGKDKGYAEISNKQGQFKDRDLYLVVYGLDGKVWAHGANEKMIGRVLIDLKDRPAGHPARPDAAEVCTAFAQGGESRCVRHGGR